MGSKNKNMYLYVAAGVLLIILVIGFVMWNRSSEKPPAQAAALPPPPKKEQPRVQAPPPPPNPDHETKLTDTDGSGKPAIVMFYANWCGPSKAALPEWQKLETALKGSPVQTIGLEDSQFKKEIMENGIKGYPTIRLYPSGFPNTDFIEYQGPRVFENLMQFVKSGGRS